MRPSLLLSLILPLTAVFGQDSNLNSFGLPSGCVPALALMARGFGSPDDLASFDGHVVFGDIRSNVVAEIERDRAKVIISPLHVPEGIISDGPSTLIVVEQALNRLEKVNVRTHLRMVFLPLTNDTSLEGVDSISRIGPAIVIPNSPYGSVLRLTNGKLTTLLIGLDRPTSVAQFHGGMAIADENANAIWLFKSHRLTRLASVPTPDDVVNMHGALLAVTLGDGGLWEIRPHLLRLRNHLDQPQGLLVTGHNTVAVASSGRNAIFRVTVSNRCLS